MTELFLGLAGLFTFAALGFAFRLWTQVSRLQGKLDGSEDELERVQEVCKELHKELAKASPPEPPASAAVSAEHPSSS